MTDEYTTLKSEQLDRIKQRDGFLNLNVVAVGIVVAIAVRTDGSTSAWLLIPWITTIMGWAYLSNDDKVSAIARHIRAAPPTTGALHSWEVGPKGLLPVPVRRYADILIYLLSFAFPTPAAIILYANNHAWSFATVLLATLEVLLSVSLVAMYLFSVQRRK